MTEKEVIIVDAIPPDDYLELVGDCVAYALISLPFTVDRMKIPDEKRRALNIAKGKLAETLFRWFCTHNGIQPDFAACETPFWTTDRRDFLLNGLEWDIKNNFLYSEELLLGKDYTALPALVPNRFRGDQWSKRHKRKIPESAGVGFLFTFLRSAGLNHGKRGEDFLKINLDERQQSFLRELYAEYKGLPQKSAPFSESAFWDKMKAAGEAPFFNLRRQPALVVTGFAGKTHWPEFRDTGPGDRANNFQKNKVRSWYKKTRRGSCDFMDDALWTTITNATLPIGRLPSFFGLFPHLKDGMVYGRLRG